MTNAPGDAAHGPDAADRMAHDFETASLRDGETVDATAHARRNAEMKASAYPDLDDIAQAILEVLDEAGGRLQSREAKLVIERETSYSATQASDAAGDLADNDLLTRRRLLTDPRFTEWIVTDVGRAWVRDYGGDRDV